MIFYVDNQLNWIATHFAIFNVALIFLGEIYKHRNLFPTIRTLKKILFHFKA